MAEKSKFNKVEYDNDFKKKHYRLFTFELDREKDKDLIAYIENQPNKKAYFKCILQADYQKNKKD